MKESIRTFWYYTLGKYFCQRPPVLTLFVTNRCNARCQHCFYWQSLDKKKKAEISLDVIKKLSLDLNHLELLMISGGEPFLRDDLVEIVKIFWQNNSLKTASLASNFLLPQKTAELLEKIVKISPKLQVIVCPSLDGTEKVHDKIRGVPNAFDKVTETIRLLKELSKEAPFSICLNCVVQPLNIGELPQLYGFAQEMELPIHFIPIYVNPWLLDNTDDKQLVTFRPEQIEEIKLFFSNPQYDISPIWKACWQDHLRVIGGEKRRFPCALLRHHAFLDTDGNMFICWADDSLVYGNVRDAPADNIWYSAAAKSARERAKAMYCSSCTQSCDPALTVRLEFFHFTRFLLKEEGRNLLRRRPQMR